MSLLSNALCTLLFCSCLAGCKKDVLHWRSATRLSTGTTDRLNKIIFTSADDGFIVGGERFHSADIIRTENGGASWEYRTFPETGNGLYGIGLSPDGDIRAVGFGAKFMTSGDRGQTWGYVQRGYYEIYTALAYLGPERCVAVGGISYETGSRALLDKSGALLRYDSIGYQLNDIVNTAPGVAFTAGTGIVEWTRDAGESWAFLNPENDNFTAIDYNREAGLLTICGITGSIWQGKSDGSPWKKIRNSGGFSQPAYRLLDIMFLSRNEGYAVGENGLVIYTDDGGGHWIELDRFTDAHLRSIVKIPGTVNVLSCGDNGELWRLAR